MAYQRLRFLFDGPGTRYLDMWKHVSAMERKLHRQFQCMKVLGGSIKDSNNSSVVEFNVAPTVWSTRTALRRGYQKYMEMVKQHFSESTGFKKENLAKYFDYKIFLNEQHMLNMSAATAAKDAAGNSVLYGDWYYSQYVTEDPDGTAPSFVQTNRDNDNFYAHIVGPHAAGSSGTAGDNWKSIGLIESWYKSRPKPDNVTPDVTISNITGDPLNALFDESDATDEVLNLVMLDNNGPPYAQNSPFGVQTSSNSSGHNLQRVAFAATQDGAGQISYFQGFEALCGLIEIDISQDPTNPGIVELLIDVDVQGMKI